MTKAYVYLPKKVVFFYSYKSGNSSLVSWLYNLVSPKLTKGMQIRNKRNFLTSPNISVSINDAIDLIINCGFHGVFLGRNPYSRIASAYVNKFVVDGERWIIERNNLEKFSDEFMGENSEISFNKFIDIIYHQYLNKLNINPHFSPQIDLRLIRFDIFHDIIRLECVDKDLKNVCEKYDIECIPFPCERSTIFIEANPLVCCGDFSNFFMSGNKITPKAYQLINKINLDKINFIYKNDFDVLGYQKLIL